MNIKNLFFISCLLTADFSCSRGARPGITLVETNVVKTGADQLNELLPLISGKVIAVLANQTSMLGEVHLIDTLLKLKVNVKLVFAPEHGFRGEAEAGEVVFSGKDAKTGLAVISLYGEHKKPTQNDLEGIEMVLFDIQDVGARFYTYISTLQYLMEACAEKNIPLLILDRPNPNGNYVDGPVLIPKFSTFVGMNEIPVVHGLTIAEYALMLNGEGWLKNEVKCKVEFVKVKNWNHNKLYVLPIAPSPNLPNMSAIYLYPSLCFFEGTIVSVGRGTDFPFQVFGYPEMPGGKFAFTPKSIKGKSVKPLYEDRLCSGVDLSIFTDQKNIRFKQINLKWLIDSYNSALDKKSFFNNFFDNLAGTDQLRMQIIAGMDEDEIRKSWQSGLEEFKTIRKKYLLYKDFE